MAGSPTPTAEPADPFEDVCQNCGADIPEGEEYHTVVIKGKEVHVCKICHDKFEDSGAHDPSDPDVYSPT